MKGKRRMRRKLEEVEKEKEFYVDHRREEST